MDANEAREEIRLIRDMVEKTRVRTLEKSHLFFFWGIWIILAILGMYALVLLKKFDWIGLNWVVFTGLGWIYTVVYAVKSAKEAPAETYAQSSAKHLSIGCGIAFLLTGLVFPFIGLYSYAVIPPLIAAVAGIMLYVMGGIYEWNLLKACGILWWFGSIGTTFVSPYWRTLVFVPLILLAYLWPAWILRKKTREAKAPE